MALYETIKFTFQRRHFLKIYDSYSIGFSQKKWKKIKKENARKIAESTFVTVIFKHFNQIVETSIRILSSGYEQNPSFDTFPQLSFPFVIFFHSQEPPIISNNNPTIFNKSAKVFCSKGNIATYLNLLYSSYNLEVRKIIGLFKFIKLGPWLNSFFQDPLWRNYIYIYIYAFIR